MLSAQQSKVLAPHKPIAPRLPDTLPASRPLRSMVGGLWMIDANFKSTILIKNDLDISPITVTPILYLGNGKPVQLTDVELETAGTATINVNDALNAKGIAPWATLSGYVEIQYKWPWDPLCVTVTSVDTVHSLIFTNGLRSSLPITPKEKAAMAKRSGTQTVEGMWWKQEPGVSAFVALSNTSDQPVLAQLQVSDSLSKPLGTHSLTVSPHGTKTVNLQELQSAVSAAGGLRVTYSGPVNQLLINGGLEDQANGYSADLPFVPVSMLPTKSTAQTFAELGLMKGAADPMMQFPTGTTFTPYSLLRNVSNQPATVTPTIFWMQGAAAHSSKLRPLTLLPYQAQSVDVPGLLSLAGLSNFNGSFNLVFDVQGSVLMASGSVDQKNTYVFEVMPTAVKESASKGVGYWSTANGDDTMVTLWNPADEDQDFVFTVLFSRGHYNLAVHLEPRATRSLSILEIVQNQIPDKDGNVIPMDVHNGGIKISGASGAENEHILLAIDAGIYNVRKATCVWTCLNCAGAISATVAVDPFSVAVGAQTQLTFTVRWKSGSTFDETKIATWSSNYINLATVSAGLVHGVAAGSLDVTASGDGIPLAGQSCGNPPPPCPVDTGIQDVGRGTVQVPTSLSIVAGTDSTTTEASCSAGSFGTGCGVTRSFKYQVNDQNGNPMQVAGLEVWDVLTTTKPNDLQISGYVTTCSPPNTGPCSVTTNSQGQFQETPGLLVCSTVCRKNNACITAGQTNATQTVHVGSASIVQQLVYYCDHVTVNGN